MRSSSTVTPIRLQTHVLSPSGTHFNRILEVPNPSFYPKNELWGTVESTNSRSDEGVHPEWGGAGGRGGERHGSREGDTLDTPLQDETSLLTWCTVSRYNPRREGWGEGDVT